MHVSEETKRVEYNLFIFSIVILITLSSNKHKLRKKEIYTILILLPKKDAKFDCSIKCINLN